MQTSDTGKAGCAPAAGWPLGRRIVPLIAEGPLDTQRDDGGTAGGVFDP